MTTQPLLAARLGNESVTMVRGGFGKSVARIVFPDILIALGLVGGAPVAALAGGASWLSVGLR